MEEPCSVGGVPAGAPPAPRDGRERFLVRAPRARPGAGPAPTGYVKGHLTSPGFSPAATRPPLEGGAGPGVDGWPWHGQRRPVRALALAFLSRLWVLTRTTRPPRGRSDGAAGPSSHRLAALGACWGQGWHVRGGTATQGRRAPQGPPSEHLHEAQAFRGTVKSSAPGGPVRVGTAGAGLVPRDFQKGLRSSRRLFLL